MEMLPVNTGKQAVATNESATSKPWIGRLVIVSPQVAKRYNKAESCSCEYYECSGDCDCDGDAGPPNPG